MSDMITADDILGKDAVDQDGSIVGVVVKLHIDRDKKVLTGITIDQGFLKPDLFIGINFISRFGVDAILLKMVPLDNYRGLEVLTFDGASIGFVKKVVLDGKLIKELLVKRSNKTFINDVVAVSISDVELIGVRVILKKGFKVKKAEK